MKNANGYNESDIRKDYHNLTKLLIEKNMTITTMESATSGQIASLITDTEGASAILKGAFITYCNEAKIMQGVPQKSWINIRYIQKKLQRPWRKPVTKTYNANIGIGVTGTMGEYRSG